MPARDDVSLWSVLKNNAGKELSKISMPVEMNEPLSFLQRLSENMEYTDLIYKAAASESPIERLEYVAAFAIASVSSNHNRLGKPFNPLLGETYELVRSDVPEAEFHIVCEQVSHHPPVSAFHAEGGNVFHYYGSICPKMKFWGKNLEIEPKGLMTLELLQHGEIYTWKNVPCFLQNLIVGQPLMEHIGSQEIHCRNGKYRCEMAWKTSGAFTHKKPHRVEGHILPAKGEQPLRVLSGSWNESMSSYSAAQWKTIKESKERSLKRKSVKSSLLNGTINRLGSLSISQHFGFDSEDTEESTSSAKSHSNSNSSPMSIPSPFKLFSSSSHSPDPEEAGRRPKSADCSQLCPEIDIAEEAGQMKEPVKVLWKVHSKPDNSKNYYNFTQFAMSLNEWITHGTLGGEDSLGDKSHFPPTDSRYRKDIRLLESGQIEAAAFEKARLEDSQRLRAKKISRGNAEDCQPNWFKLQPHVISGKMDWHFDRRYFQRNWSDCEILFD